MFSWPQDFATNFQFLLRWIHFLAGITWIGMLYFFNLVNVQFQKELDAATKGKVVPLLMPRALFWFRWGAIVTWFSGFIYYFLLVDAEKTGHLPIVYFLVGWSIAFVALSGLFRASVAGGPLKDGRVLALVVAIVVLFIGYATALMARNTGASSRTLSIMVGGGIGTIMLLNVWMIIWPLQKRIIAATVAAAAGTPAPADQPRWARRAFLASRTNAWLSIPMLFFMGAASHFPIFSTLEKAVSP